MQGDIDERKRALCRLLGRLDTDAGRGKSSKVPLGNWGRLTVALYIVFYIKVHAGLPASQHNCSYSRRAVLMLL